MIFISAGHVLYGPNKDPGAVGSGTTEAQETVLLRNLICSHLDAQGAKYIKDNDDESLKEYLKRIQPGNASVVLELHFNAANGKASGVETLIEEEADRLDFAFAKEITDATVESFNTTNWRPANRGVKKESESHRGRLGLMREEGIIGLLEVCFIDNPIEMQAYKKSANEIAKKIAEILIKYDKIIL